MVVSRPPRLAPSRRGWVVGAATLALPLAAGLLVSCSPIGISPIPQEPAGAQSPTAYDAILRGLLSALIFLANVAGGLVVGVATVRGLITFALDLARNRGAEVPKEAIRLSLGRSLALALEFQLGADILGTALNPSLQDITTLATIIILRTLLNFFLGREIREAVEREQRREQLSRSKGGEPQSPEARSEPGAAR